MRNSDLGKLRIHLGFSTSFRRFSVRAVAPPRQSITFLRRPELSPGNCKDAFQRAAFQRLYSTQKLEGQCEDSEKHAPILSEGVSAPAGSTAAPNSLASNALQRLENCPGCGAYAQYLNEGVPGHYSLNRKAVKSFVEESSEKRNDRNPQDEVFTDALANASPELRKELTRGLTIASEETKEHATNLQPLCDRCHTLLYHHHSSTSIDHPSVDSLAATLAESPWKTNHIYHVVDAADFPMSLVPKIHRLLSVAPQRARNRRARRVHFVRGRKTEMSFIITRSDLLAPKKEQVDRLMPYLIETLREALGRVGQHVRLGNVRCVSAKRGWWTREVKESIWKRGGGGWMVGKVNVGKSNFFETVFPKGRTPTFKLQQAPNDAQLFKREAKNPSTDLAHATNDLLPPAQKETLYPQMPTVSSLPGTTASPIRVPFGNGRGELVDLPGLERSSLGRYIQDGFVDKVVMKKRIIPEQHSIKPGHSLLLGGLIRIMSLAKDVSLLAYPFVPLDAHVSKNCKKPDMSNNLPQQMTSVVKEGLNESFKSAGSFYLKWDVTRERAGPLVAKDATSLKPENLPFKVFSTDILIESIGWVELVAQVRRKDFEDMSVLSDEDFPGVEVFSPGGEFVSTRRPMGAYNLGKAKAAKLRKRIQPINRRLKERRKNS